ncbi:kinase domain-containing protein [Achaetomium macrosporum]|uniref:non-specific serine/threonine protein kinase n=1 Tax=Achaetomium macrosporum TaxID=79813 RepID=A0AAN7HDR2_9PEZI|nr:kinase domain-containing protein [Achaetomium macrosporum]
MAASSHSVASASPRSSQPPSVKSIEVSKSPKLNGQNGQIVTPNNGAIEQTPKPADKGSMKDRLTRMFSAKDVSQRAAMAETNDNATQARKPQNGVSSTASPPPTKVANGKEVPLQRFALNPDVQGGHEHHLKSSRRQEKLSDMIKAFLGRKPEQQAPDNDLSLVSNWVDNLRKEKDHLASDKKINPNQSATLVEKYGKCQEIVGRGAFGIVRISHKKLDNGLGEKLFAVKEFRRRPEETEKKYSKRLTAEFCISSSLRHPNVIHTLDLLKDSKGDYCEVMEFCAGGDLYTLVLSAGKLEVQEADCFFKQMMRGVEYMHEMGVAHRDLKPENLLLTTHGALKITDFGNGECFRMAWENDAHMVSGLCGSAPYIAPEEYTAKEFDARAVDVWACGVIYMAMRTGRHLWRVAKKDEDEFYSRYLEGRKDEEGYTPIEQLHRARCRNVIYSILDPNPTRRITASQVLKSEWGREIQLCKAGEEGL